MEPRVVGAEVGARQLSQLGLIACLEGVEATAQVFKLVDPTIDSPTYSAQPRTELLTDRAIRLAQVDSRKLADLLDSQPKTAEAADDLDAPQR